MKKNLFCTKPFKWFEVTQLNDRGQTYMCCPSWLDTPIGNVKYQSIDEIWNGEKAQKIRESILDGSFKYCNESRCPYLQTESGYVSKIDDIDDDEIQNIIKNKITDLPYGPREINTTFDTSCNLSCPSCRTQIIIETNAKDEIEMIQDKIENEAFKDAQFIYLSGNGDPFGSPFHRKWLHNLNIKKLPNLQKIKLHTNGMLWTPRVWEKIPNEIKRFIKITEISIDAATKNTYEINRRGGDFSILLRNLEFISTLRKNGPLEEVTISMVVQDNNYNEMPSFVELGKRFGFDCVYFSKMVNWGTFSDKEYMNRAVHLKSHVNHDKFLHLIGDEIFDDDIVNMGNLTEYRVSDDNIIQKAAAYKNSIKSSFLRLFNDNIGR